MAPSLPILQSAISPKFFETYQNLDDIIQQLKMDDLNLSAFLPRLVVVGDQTMAGRTFLPCGDGIVTRTPIVLNFRPDKEASKPYAYVYTNSAGQQRKNDKLHKDEDIVAAIRSLTDVLAPYSEGLFTVSDTPIVVEFHSPHVVPLCLTDTPGVIALEDANNIAKQLETMAYSHITDANTKIVAVVDAGQDYATSKGLGLANKADNTGQRTLLVRTKIDRLGDVEFNTKLEISPLHIKPQLGIVLVRNFTDKDEAKNLTMADVQSEEKKLLRQHLKSPHDPEKHGTQYLLQLLSQLLYEAICAAVPRIATKVNEELNTRTHFLDNVIGRKPMNQNSVQAFREASQIINRYVDDIMGNLKGEKKFNSKKLYGGAKIADEVSRDLYKKLAGISLFNLTDKEYGTAIQNAKGIYGSLFTPSHVLKLLLEDYIQQIKKPCFEVLGSAFEIGELISNQSAEEIIQTFPCLRTQLQTITQQFLVDKKKSAEQAVNEDIDMETDSVHLDGDLFQCYLRKSSAGSVPADRISEPGSMSSDAGTPEQIKRISKKEPLFDDIDDISNDEVEKETPTTVVVNINSDTKPEDIKTIRRYAKAYLNMLKDKAFHYLKQVLMKNLTMSIHRELKTYLLHELTKANDINQLTKLFAEDEHTAQERMKTLEQVKLLKRAVDTLNDISLAGAAPRV